MKRSRFSEEQVIGILKEHQAGLGAQGLAGLLRRPFFGVASTLNRESSIGFIG